MQRFDRYWNAAPISPHSVAYRTIPDDSVRLIRLGSGESRPDPAAFAERYGDRRWRCRSEGHPRGLRRLSTWFPLTSIRATRRRNPLGMDPRVGQAFELSLDRDALNQVTYEGLFVPASQTEPVGTQFYDKAHLMRRDVDKEKALLAQTGTPSPSFTLPSPIARRWSRSAR
ncbi:ABC transporter substrate-binding protein [Neorhizobium sp. P12A]|uniref:ABC transporter substrate-binding protein n=1 Tax=Neorhizobium sp. P12A TaxID=2268027 RepID=UPI00165DA520|nr:ABC transporter substrate-binding protein [Neorhizobium sp. P12A]